MQKKIITVSRQYGAGGRELAGILAKKLGVKLYDRQLVHIAAAKLGIDDLSEKDLLELENNVQPLALSFLPFQSFGMNRGRASEAIFHAETAVIQKIAAEGPCVILGRSADYALQEREDVFSLFVCATDAYREQRGKEVYGGKSLKELDAEDRKRARYYSYYTGRDWGAAKNYDLVLRTDGAPLENIADGVLAYLEKIQ